MPTMASQGRAGAMLDSTSGFGDTALMRILILGGTSEAGALAGELSGRSGFEPLLSLAGRTSAPRRLPVATRCGGFGGAEGLARFLVESRIDAVLDATHPFAAVISH